MPLPKLVSPIYEIKTAVSPQKIIKFVPFRVKEEKILLVAMESEDEAQIKNAIITIFKNCVVGKVKYEELAIFDLEYLFLNIRAQSIGSNIDVKIPCDDSIVDDGIGNMVPTVYVPVSIDINDIKVQVPKEHTNVIKLNDDITLIMKYPTFDMFINDNFITGSTIYDTFNVCTTCIDEIIEGTDIHKASDYSKEELDEFVGTLTNHQFQLVQEFIMTMPKLEHSVTVTNPNTDVDTTVVLSGLGSFFS